jgi:hypothetical protein
MKNIELNESTLLSIAQFQADTFKAKGVEGVGKMRCLQSLCQHFYSKPYEELKSTIFANTDTNSEDHEHCNVVVLRYTTDLTIVAVNGKAEHAFCNTDYHRYDIKEIEELASQVAKTNNTSWRTVNLPMALHEDDAQGASAVIQLAKDMNVFDHKETLFEQLQEDDITVLINGNVSAYALDGDMDIHLQDESESDEADTMNTCIWHTETYGKDGDYHEYFLTLKEIANAKPTGERNTWIVNYEISPVAFVDLTIKVR